MYMDLTRGRNSMDYPSLGETETSFIICERIEGKEPVTSECSWRVVVEVPDRGVGFCKGFSTLNENGIHVSPMQFYPSEITGLVGPVRW
jgi:hypothetical protein